MLELHELRAIHYRFTLDSIEWIEGKHSRDEKGRFTGDKGIIAAMKETELKEFAVHCLSIADKKVETRLGSVTNHERIHTDTGFDVQGFARVLDNYGIRHTIKKHGNFNTESARGQIAVTVADFLLIPLITSEPDKIFYDGKNKIGRDVLVFCKVIDGIGYRHVEEIRPKAQVVALDSLRKKKGAWIS